MEPAAEAGLALSTLIHAAPWIGIDERALRAALGVGVLLARNLESKEWKFKTDRMESMLPADLGALKARPGMRVFALVAKQPDPRVPAIRIGRAPQSDVCLDHTSISKVHALWEFQGEDAVLTDVDSANGTFLNAVRVPPSTPTPVPDGATVYFGTIATTYLCTHSLAGLLARWRETPSE